MASVMKRTYLIFASLMAIAPATLHAQEAAPAAATSASCPSTPAALDEPWTAWNGSQRAIEAGKATGAMPTLFLGAPLKLKLVAPDVIALARPPARRLDPAKYSGLATIELERAGRVGLALSAAAWVDVISRGVIEASIDHEHGPDCSGIRKIVWFDLQPGTHVVQIVDNPSPTVTIMVAVVQPSIDD